MAPPRSLMAAIGPEAVTSAAQADLLWAKYGTEIDRESAREKLAARLAQAMEPAPEPEPTPAPEPEPAPRRRRRAADDGGDTNPVVDYLTSREGKAMVKKVTRGVLGMLRKRL